MAQADKGEVATDELHRDLLVLMKPGAWYCSSSYEGCEEMPDWGNRASGRVFQTLAGRGFVESEPVFEGFMTEKHRITKAGVKWLKQQGK